MKKNYDSTNDWYYGLQKYNQVSATRRVYNDTGINRHHKRHEGLSADIVVTILFAVVFTVGMFVWLA